MIGDDAIPAQADVVNLFFIEESSEHADGPNDDILDVGTDRRRPRVLIGLLVATVVAIAVVVVVQRQPAAEPVAAPSTPLVTTPLPSRLAGIDETFSSVYLRARDAGTGEDVVHISDATSCKAVKIGTSPQHEAGLALQRGLHGYRLIDTSRTIDQTAGLCALQVRAHDSSGTVALLMVSSPSPDPVAHRRGLLETHTAPLEDLVVQYSRFTTADGWIVVVGTSGPRGRQPAETLLGALAMNSALRW